MIGANSDLHQNAELRGGTHFQAPFRDKQSFDVAITDVTAASTETRLIEIRSSYVYGEVSLAFLVLSNLVVELIAPYSAASIHEHDAS
nr:hypothetical protein CFP56_78660 [Quercus suber]